MLTPWRSRSAEAVGVGGDEPQPAGRRGEEHAGEDRAGVVARRAGHHLAQRLGERGRLDPHAALARPRAAAGTPTPTSVRSVVAKRPASIWASSSASSTDTVSPSSWRTISENSRAGTTALPSPSVSAGTRTRIVSSRSVPTSSSDPPVSVTPAGPTAPASPGARRDRTLGGGDGIGEGVALATELHSGLLRRSSNEIFVVVVVGPVDWG